MIILWVGKEHVRTGVWGMRKLTLLAGWSKEYERNKVVSVVCQKRVACVVLKGVIDCCVDFEHPENMALAKLRAVYSL